MRSFLLLSPIVTSLLPLSTVIPSVQAQEGSCSVAAPCWNGACCSQWGYCGYGEPWCGPGCQSGPCYPAGPPPPPTPPPVPTPPPTMRPTLYPQPTVTPVTAAPFDVGNCEAVKMEVNFGYYEDWAVYRNSACNPLQPDAIEVARFGYTHLAYSFAQVSTDGVLEPYNYYPGSTAHIGPYAAFNSLRDYNVGLKTLIAVGGWTMDQYRFSDAAMTAASRTKFANSVVDFLNTYKFDGIDMDWEYPVSRQGRPQDKANYPLLLQAIRAAFNTAGRSDWLITVATSINLQRLDDGYDMPAMEPHIDWFNMMSYDIYGSFSAEAGSNTDMSYIRTTMAVIFDLWEVPREKLVLGLAAYGRSSRLSNPTCTTPGCPINGAGLTGCHGESGNLPWFQIKRDYVDTGNYKTLELNMNTGSMEMISTDGYLFTSFDNEVTFNIKYQYAFENCMRGIMWWAVDLITEPIVLLDPSPTLSPTSSDIPSASMGPSIAPSTSLIPTKAPPPTDSPTRMPTRSPIVPPPIPPCGASCPAGLTGNFATFECTGFRMCVSGGEVASFACAPGTLFDDSLGVCNWASAVSCPCVTTTPPPTPPPVPPGTPTPPPTPPSPTNAGCTPCPASGYTLKSSLDCTGFHYCNVGQLGSYVQCPSGTLFSDAIKGCDWDYNVNCACTSGTAIPPPTPPPVPPGTPTPPPTPPSPTNAGCTPCPASGYTLISSLDCTGFHYCNVGQLGSYVQCPSGTLFSDAIKGCDWDYNVNCACTSGTAPLPTPPPTPPPAPPSPTGPTPVGTGLWYPDWERTSTCAGDGRQPGWMGAAYFFNTRTECCSAWFWWQATCDA